MMFITKQIKSKIDFYGTFAMPICGYIIILNALFLTSCRKEWLDEKPIQNIINPSTLNDYQALLNNDLFVYLSQPSFGELGSDNYYLKDADYDSRPEYLKNIYKWASIPYLYADRDVINDWSAPYKAIYTCNVILDGIERIAITSSNNDAWRNIKGTAYFQRGYAYFNLSQEFCKPFIKQTATSDLGLILRTDYDVNLNSTRSSVKETYDLILSDIEKSINFLPNQQQFKTQPTKAAAYGLLSRVYLTMQDYSKALIYADSCLMVNSTLIDYNNSAYINSSADNPFLLYNPEVIFHSIFSPPSPLPSNFGRGNVDTTLYRMYNEGDLRKTLFFKEFNGRMAFVGSYNGPDYMFNGIATDEIYLIKSECLARINEISSSISALNALLQKRWNQSLYQEYHATNKDTLLSKILDERRKELCFRGIRWSDLRRLNQEENLKQTIYRSLNNQLISLPPNDDRYVYPIPNDEIRLSNIEQNLR